MADPEALAKLIAKLEQISADDPDVAQWFVEAIEECCAAPDDKARRRQALLRLHARLLESGRLPDTRH
jgi:hypothetical protein